MDSDAIEKTFDDDHSWAEMSSGLSDRLEALRRAGDELDAALDVTRRGISAVTPRLDERAYGVGRAERWPE